MLSRQVSISVFDLGRHLLAKGLAIPTSNVFDIQGKNRGGNCYNTQGAYLGRGFSTLAFQQLYRGMISRAELADVLGVKADNINGLEQRLLAGSS